MSVCCPCGNEFLKIEADKILLSVNYVPRKIEGFGYVIY